MPQTANRAAKPAARKRAGNSRSRGRDRLPRKLKLSLVVVEQRLVVLKSDFPQDVFVDEICALHLPKPIAQPGMRKIRSVKSPHHHGQKCGVTSNALAREE